MKKILLACLSLMMIPIGAAAEPDKAGIENSFQQWLTNDFWITAQKQGISKPVFHAALGQVSINWKLPDLVIPGETPPKTVKQHQAEFGSPAAYFHEKSIGAVVNGGKARLSANAKTLKAIEQKYGVPAEISLAIWGRETAYGTVKIPYNAFDVLATKAFLSPRKDIFQEELLAALKIVQNGYMDAASMKSSWAGALGQPQFMPTSYLKYAVDFDGDGHRNIWTSTPDTLASIAHYLSLNNWQKGRHWGLEVIVPETVSCSLEGPDQGKTLLEWQKLGIKRINNAPFDASENNKQNYLLMPAGRLGPAFLVTDNFYALKAYNMSDLYALFIGSSADRIAGGSAFKTPWQKVAPLYRSDVEKMQKRLQKQGYDVGKPDGLAGFKTRRSIGLWQQKNGQRATCFPNRALVGDIR